MTEAIGYPVVVRPSYVLGGRAMQIVYDEIDPPEALLPPKLKELPDEAWLLLEVMLSTLLQEREENQVH